MAKDLQKKREARKNIERYHLVDKVTIIDALVQRFGAPALETIHEARALLMQNLWKEVADGAKDNSIETLIDTLWSEEFFDYTFTKDKDGKTKMNVSWCLFAELAKELDMQELAFEILCVDDQYICEGFNSNIEFTRTKTLMEGHDCCDHCYCYKTK